MRKYVSILIRKSITDRTFPYYDYIHRIIQILRRFTKMFKAISKITNELEGITAGESYTIVNTKHQSNTNICVINDFGVHQRINKRHFTITVDSDYNSKLNIVQYNVV
jgi:hypothetical protein